MEMIRVIMPILLSIAEQAVESLSGTMDFMEFQAQMAEKLQETGRSISQAVLEGLEQQIRKDRNLRPQWQICRSGDRKEMLTRFGVIRYERTYYRNKEDGSYSYLVDEQAGYTAHMRMDTQVKSKLVAGAANVSYRKSADLTGSDCGTSISGQTVLRSLRDFERPARKEQKRILSKVLYIEADEDHVASQTGPSIEARLVYIHEGWAETKRRELRNPLYLSSVDEDSYSFWERVWEEVDARYEVDKIETMYVMGDGAAWIQGAFDVFPKATFVLDRFHLMKYIKKAVGSNQEHGKTLRSALRFGNREKMHEVLSQVMEEASTESRKNAIAEAWKYIENQWEGIRQLYKEAELRCSAEGHVSHVLSERLSSRPMGWSRTGAANMANVRVCQANGVSVAQEYVRQLQRKSLPVVYIAEKTVEVQRKKLKRTREILGNIPVLKGAKNYLYWALQGLSGALA